MAFRFILLVLPTLALASIGVEILIRKAKDVKVNYKGYDIAIINETEITTFNLTFHNLINAVNSYSGKLPANVIIRKPTFGSGFLSLDGKHEWHEVTRIFMPRRVKVFWPTGIQTVVTHQTFENNSTTPATFNVGISHSVQNTVRTSWRTSGELSGIKINYGINNQVANDDREPFRYTLSWGQHTLQSQTVTVGASSNMYMKLQPGEAVIARLVATRELVNVEAEYEARLAGQIVAHYLKPWKGSSFYIMPINRCLKSAGLSNQKTSWEVIDIEFISDYKVFVSDLRDDHILMEEH